MHRMTLIFEVRILVDDDHEGVPEPDEVKLQLERAILDDVDNVKAEFGILDCTAVYKGEEDSSASCPKRERFATLTGPVEKGCLLPVGHEGNHKFNERKKQ